MSAAAPLITVAVCTYNRAELLDGCLASLAAQTADPALFEVILVDNNSADATAEIAAGFTGRHAHFRYVKEAKQGLSNARNRGWQESRGSYVAYMDDDAKAFPDWVAVMADFISRKPGVAAFGGPYIEFSTAAIPAWFPPGYGSWTLDGGERRIKIGEEWINGTNMVYRADLLRESGGFSKDLGMTGSVISYGEETHLLLRLNKAGHEVWFIPDLRVWHLLAEYKLHLAWLLKASLGVGKSWSKTSGVRRNLYSHFRGLVKAGLLGCLRFASPEAIPFKRRLYRALEPLCQEWGALAGFLIDQRKF